MWYQVTIDESGINNFKQDKKLEFTFNEGKDKFTIYLV